MKIKRALVSVSDKTGLEVLAPFLMESGVEMVSTGGTKNFINNLPDVSARDISDLTGFPEIMDGRVKTLHPKVHGGILNVRGNREHQEAMEVHGIVGIDLVIVNLYPFLKVVKGGCSFDVAIENIDIGGPSMIRGAAKNYKDVTVVVDPTDYERLINMMSAFGGETTEDFRFYLAKKVFKLTSEYDQAIYDYLSAWTEK